MLHIANGLLVCLLWINLAGLALAVRRWTSSWLLARIGSPIALVAILFFLEHFVGLGALGWVYPLTTGISFWLIARDRAFLRARWRTETIFASAFLYALAWRYAFPNIDASSEKITDLSFVANYLHGGRLPPIDSWLPPFRFDMYYALQHYAAAVIGRIFGLPAGTAYNLGFCVLVALVTTAAAGTAMLLVRRRFPAILLTAGLLFGGAGTAPLIHFIEPSPPLHAGVRFIGSSFSPEYATSPLGRRLLAATQVNRDTPELPIELFAYLVGLGDFHPPLSGYLLLMLALLAIVHIEAGLGWEAAHALLAASVPLTLAANAWDFPLQGLLAGGYLVARVWRRKPICWKMLVAGAGAALLLLQPFLSHFPAAAADAHMRIRLVPASMHTPPLLWILTFYPAVLVLALQLLCGERSRLTVGLCLAWIALLAISELFFVDDLYGGKYERFNTALKWWAWTYSGALLLIGGFNLRARSPVCRWGTVAVLILICAFGGDLAAQYVGTSKPKLGQIDGAAWVRDDVAENAILDALRQEPPSIVLQRMPQMSYTVQPALTIFAGHRAFLGWPGHENVWRHNRADIEVRRREVELFFNGDLPDSSTWLEANHIRHVLWLRDDNQLAPHTFDKVNGLVKDRYLWRAYYIAGDYRVGMWTYAGAKPN
jgi:uncharacterized membrane protein